MDHQVTSDLTSDEVVRPKLNVLALPTYTTILFGLIVFVVLTTVLSSILPDSNLWWPPLLLGVVLLTIRDFLNSPEQQAQNQHLYSADSPELYNLLENLTQATGQVTPQIMLSQKGNSVWSFGTFRRHFIAIGADLSKVLVDYMNNSQHPSLKEVAKVVLAHEVAHFIHGDVVRAGIARSLLKTTVLVAIIYWIYEILIFGFAMLVGPQLVDEQLWNVLKEYGIAFGINIMPLYAWMKGQDPQILKALANPQQTLSFFYSMIYYTQALWPFVISCSLLYFFVWRKLIRTRELYADARAAEMITSAGGDGVSSVLIAMNVIGSLMALSENSSRLPPILTTARKRLNMLLSANLLAFRSNDSVSRAALADPILIFGSSRQIAIWTGLVILLLELTLQSSLTVQYLHQPGAHLSLLAIYMVFSLWLLPQICNGLKGGSLAKIIIQMVFIFTVIKLSLNVLSLLLVGFYYLVGKMSVLGRLFDVAVCALVGGCGNTVPRLIGQEISWTELIQWQIIAPISYFSFFTLPILVFMLWLETSFIRWALTWYSLGFRVQQIFFFLRLTGLSFILFVTVPIGNRLFFPLIYNTWPVLTQIGFMIGLLSIIVGSILFFTMHKRLARCCSICKRQIPGHFDLGKSCPHCGQIQHKWLIADY